MKRILWLAGLLPALAFAKGGDQKAATTVLVSPPAASEAVTTSQTETDLFTSEAKRRLSVGAAAAMWRGAVDADDVYLGIGFDATFRLGSSPIYLGVETAALREVGIYSGTSTMVRISPTAIARFSWGRRVHPYVGISSGFVLDTVRTSSLYTNDSATSTSFEVLARHGIDFDLGRKFCLTLEPSWGLVRSNIFFSPRFSATFAF